MTAGVPAGQPPHLDEPPQAPELPDLLLGPGRLGHGHVDAEHRGRLAGPRADAFARRGRAPDAVPVPPGDRARAVQRRARRPARRPADRDRHPGASMVFAAALAAVTLGGVVEPWMVYLLTGLRGISLVVDHPARQAFTFQLVGARRAAQRGRAQLRALQRDAGDRAGSRRGGDRRGRAGRLLPPQRRQLRRRAGEPDADPAGGARAARPWRRAPHAAAAGAARRSRSCAACRSPGSSSPRCCS